MRLIVLSLACLAMLAAAPDSKPIRVYILSGQSNMDGRGKKSELVGELASWAKPQADVSIAYSNSNRRGPYATDGFVPLEPGYSVPPGTKERKLPGDTFGPEVSFGRTIADAYPNARIVLIKYSEGGTNLQKDWKPAATQPTALYPQWRSYVQKQLKSLGDGAKVEGFIWHQGESDASLPEGEYQRLLTAFIAQVREDLGSPELPIVVGEVYDNQKRDRVRAGERATAAAVPNVFFVSCEGLKTLDAGTHFDTPSQIEFGKRMARALIEKPKEPAK